MSFEGFVSGANGRAGERLISLYIRTTLVYLLVIWLLWAIGIEAIYGSPTPFYALYYPGFDSPFIPSVVLLLSCTVFLVGRRFLPMESRASLPFHACWIALAFVAALSAVVGRREYGLSSFIVEQWAVLRWHLLALAVFTVFFGSLFRGLRRTDWFDAEPSRRFTSWFLISLIAFAFLFPGAIAMLRDGTHGIAQAYERHGYEYVSDIGVTRSIRTLFHDYAKLHPYLSMHAKVHPPGPIALLWLISYVAGQDPLPLSVATMLVGALGVLPLYLWAADLINRRVALTCCVLCSLMPSIVLFSATSADILFMPFTLTTLFLFWRALHRRSVGYALAAGVGYGLMSLLSFSLLSLGAYFAFVGLWRSMDPKWRRPVLQTALVMIAAFLLFHLAVRAWSGFDILACFRASRAQFDVDQVNLDLLTPRYPSWFWQLGNPACWFFFAGIPVSVLFVWRLATLSGFGFRVSGVGSGTPTMGSDQEACNNPKPETRNPKPGVFVVCALTLAVLSFTYLGRGEGERSAMYILPFVALPAAHLIDQIGRMTRSFAPLAVTAAFLGLQCWAIESVLYTFW